MKPKTLQNGKYRIVRVLGQGGFGITYEGVQTGLNRRVAIKEFFMSDYCEREGGSSWVTIMGTKGNRVLVERFKEKFLKEAQMIAGLDDVPHIIRIYDVFQENGTAYYVMEYIAGGSLRSLVKQRGRLDEAMAKRYIAQVGEALAELHKRHIMHLDVKPDNIMLKDGEAILIDFGVSKHYDQGGDATTTTPVGRSKGYAPLEQYKQGGVQSFSPETDIYSLGATLYFLLTGENPPEATELVGSPIVCPEFVSGSMQNLIMRAMEVDKEKRPRTICNLWSNSIASTNTKDGTEQCVNETEQYLNEIKNIVEKYKKEPTLSTSDKVKSMLLGFLFSVLFIAIFWLIAYYERS